MDSFYVYYLCDSEGLRRLDVVRHRVDFDLELLSRCEFL